MSIGADSSSQDAVTDNRRDGTRHVLGTQFSTRAESRPDLVGTAPPVDRPLCYAVWYCREPSAGWFGPSAAAAAPSQTGISSAAAQLVIGNTVITTSTAAGIHTPRGSTFRAATTAATSASPG